MSRDAKNKRDKNILYLKKILNELLRVKYSFEHVLKQCISDQLNLLKHLNVYNQNYDFFITKKAQKHINMDFKT